jgi:hypothetical protein
LAATLEAAAEEGWETLRPQVEEAFLAAQNAYRGGGEDRVSGAKSQTFREKVVFAKRAVAGGAILLLVLLMMAGRTFRAVRAVPLRIAKRGVRVALSRL